MVNSIDFLTVDRLIQPLKFVQGNQRKTLNVTSGKSTARNNEIREKNVRWC